MQILILITSAVLFICSLILAVGSEKTSRKLKSEADALHDRIMENGRQIDAFKNDRQLRKELAFLLGNLERAEIYLRYINGDNSTIEDEKRLNNNLCK